MQVEIVVNLGSNDYPNLPYLAGEIHEVSDVVGKMLASRGHARILDAPEEVKVQLVGQNDPVIAPSEASVTQDIKQDKPAKAALKQSKEK